MKDRSRGALAGIGFGGLAAAKQKMNELSDDEKDARLPPPKPKRGRKIGPSGKGERKANPNWVEQDNDSTDIRGLIGYLEGSYDVLSKWEQEFLDDIKDFFARKKGLTARQYEKLVEVCDRI